MTARGHSRRESRGEVGGLSHHACHTIHGPCHTIDLAGDPREATTPTKRERLPDGVGLEMGASLFHRHILRCGSPLRL